MSTAHDQVVSLLAAGRRGLLRRTLSAGALRAVAVLAIVLAASIILLLFRPPAPAAAAISFVALAAAVLAALRYVAVPAARVPKLGTYAVRVDELLGEGRNVAINALDLGSRLPAERDPFTRALISAHVGEAAREIERADLGSIGRARGLRRWGAGLGGSLAALGAVFALMPGPSTQAAARLLNPSFTEPPTLVGLTVEPGDIEVDTGTDVTVRARLTGTKREPVLRAAATGGDWVDNEMTSAPEDTSSGSAFEFTFNALDHDVNYQVAVAGQTSETWKIRVTDPPRALGYRVTYDYPRYTGLPSETRVAATGDVTALVGTKVTLEVEVNDPEADGYLAFGGEKPALKRGADTMNRMADFIIRDARRYRVHLVDRKGRERFASPEFAVEPVPDRAPVLKVLSPGRDIDLPEEMSVQLAVTAVDDYGLTRLVLHSQVADEAETATEIARFGSREANTLHEWNLSALDLVPGDVVSYYLEIFDNDTVSGPKSTRSETYAIRFPTMDEMYADLNEEREEEVVNLEQIREEQKRLKKQVEDAAREMKKGLETGWEKQKELQAMAREQQSLQERLGEIQKSLEQTADQIEKNDLMGLEMIEKLAEIQRLMSEIQNEELKAAVQRLQEAVEKMNRSDVERALEKMKMTQEELLDSLDRTIDMLKRLQMEEKLAQQIEKAADMLERQEKLDENLEQSPSAEEMQRMAEEQKNLASDLQQSKQQLDELQKEASTEHPQMSEALEKNMDEQNMADTQQAMQQSQQSMQQKNASKAGQQSKKSRQGLQKLMTGLQQAQSSMSQEMTAELSEKLTRIQNDLLAVSKSQEEILYAPSETEANELAQRQENLATAAKRSADELFEVSKETMFVTPQLGRMLGSAIEQLEQAKQSFAQGDRGNGMERGKESQVAVNQTILALMQQNQSMCQNPGSSGMPNSMAQMQQLGQQQQQLNMDTRSMSQQLQQRLREGGDDQLSRLAARQEMIKKGLEEVQGKLGERSDVLGRLDQLAEEMGDIAKKMRDEGVPEDVLQRQEKILSRLLDAQKSVRKEDYSRRRRSETGTDTANRPSPGPIPPGLLSGPERLQSDILRGASDPYPSEYRRLVEQYFRALTAGGPRP